MLLIPLTVLYLLLFVPLAVYQTYKLYSYPASNSACAFPRTSIDSAAPFRLLIFADPQIEGNTSLRRRRIHSKRTALKDRLLLDAKVELYNARKRLDLWGNDRYLRHIQQTLRRYVQPTYITVLGDLLGSQWIRDAEFNKRADRFWNVAFSGLEQVKPEDVDDDAAGRTVDWSKKLILVAGNHDIGYSGDMTRERIERFERRFGPSNALLTFRLNDLRNISEVKEGSPPTPNEGPSLQIVNLNDLTLDQPQLYPALADESYNFIGKVIRARSDNPNQATVLLTHVPFHKSGQLCNDGPFIDYFHKSEGGGVKEQNFLTESMSKMLMDWIFGHPLGEQKPDPLKTRGIIFTGHDHVGCDTVHYFQKDDSHSEEGSAGKSGKWDAIHTPHYNTLKTAGAADWEAVREVTVTSMMGDYEGNAGFLSAWFEEDEDGKSGQWIFKYSSCKLGNILIWWVVHIVDLVLGGIGLLLAVSWLVALLLGSKKPQVPEEKKKQ